MHPSKLTPDHITILCDTREQRPLKFHDSFKVEKICLPTGDYSIKYLDHLVAIERKSISDLVMCVGRERERFEREITRLKEFEIRRIIIEADLNDILGKKYRGETHPNSVIGSLASWDANGTPCLFLSNREAAAQYVSKLLLQTAKRAARGDFQGCEKFIESINGNI